MEEDYSVRPGAPESGYSLLSPDYQSSTSFEDYEAFWSTIDSVTVEGARPAGSDAVDVALVYAELLDDDGLDALFDVVRHGAEGGGVSLGEGRLRGR